MDEFAVDKIVDSSRRLRALTVKAGYGDGSEVAVPEKP